MVAAQPAVHWESGVQDIADRVTVPATVLRTAMADFVTAWNESPKEVAQTALRSQGQIKTRLARRIETNGEEHPTPLRAGASARKPPVPTDPRPQRGSPRFDF